MAEKEDIRTEASDEDRMQTPAMRRLLSSRDKELIGDQDVLDACLDIYKDIEKGFSDQWERSNNALDYWDIYHCNLGSKQFYSGNSKIFVPIVHDAIKARTTRFVNQIFPASGKHVEVTASEEKPQALMSLLEFYIRKAKLRTKVMPALVKNGDCEGQYTILIEWVKNERHVAMRVKSKPKVDNIELEGDEEFDDIKEETITHQYPVVEVLPDADVLVLPNTSDSIEAALDAGGSVTVIRRWTKAKIRQLIRDEEIDKDEGTALLEEMSNKEKGRIPDKKSAMVDAAGSRMEGGKSIALVYMTWTKIKIEGERRIVRIFFGGPDQVLSCKRNPYWCDKVPVLSGPVEKTEGSFKGVPPVKFVETYQYAANDAVNEGMDAAAYALMPIVMTDPMKNPRVGSMILNVAAIWQTNPNDTKFAEFPPLWKDAFTIVGSCKDQVFQTLGINPAMMPQQVTAPGKKPNQAQIANEQMVDILTTADAVTTLEGEILTPMLQWFIWLDHQYRDAAITIRAFGEMGIDAEMERIEPVQMDRRFEFRWFGVEAARSAQQIQMQIAMLNVLRNIPPQSYPGYQLDLTLPISQLVENTFGPRIAPKVFKDIRKQLSLEAEFENQLLESGIDMPVHPMDEDQQHMQVHAKALQENGDMHGTIREHMMRHTAQMQLKQQAMMQQQMAALGQGPGQQGPGGGQPRSGAATQGPRGAGQGPAGRIHQDRLALAQPRAARG